MFTPEAREAFNKMFLPLDQSISGFLLLELSDCLEIEVYENSDPSARCIGTARYFTHSSSGVMIESGGYALPLSFYDTPQETYEAVVDFLNGLRYAERENVSHEPNEE